MMVDCFSKLVVCGCHWLLLTHTVHLCISQESRKSHTGPATSPGHHLHALLRQSGGGRHFTNCLHLLQLLLAVFPGENRAGDAAGHWPIIEDEEKKKEKPTQGVNQAVW